MGGLDGKKRNSKKVNLICIFCSLKALVIVIIIAMICVKDSIEIWDVGSRLLEALFENLFVWFGLAVYAFVCMDSSMWFVFFMMVFGNWVFPFHLRYPRL